MRARLALKVTHISCEIREVVLRDKPQSLLRYSPKATVPVLVLQDGTVLDESLDIMLWALDQSSADGSYRPTDGSLDDMRSLIARNDNDFKQHLDRYKYADRYEGADPLFHRTEAERFLGELNLRLESSEHLFGPEADLADWAIGPFIRQFANTNRGWFDETPYDALKLWLERFLATPLFQSVMVKYPQWHEGDPPTYGP